MRSTSLMVNRPAQSVLVVDHQHFVDADVFGEELVGRGDGVAAEFLLVDGMDLARGVSASATLALGVALLDDVAGQQADQLALAVHHGEGAEGELLLLDQSQHVPDQLVGRRP